MELLQQIGLGFSVALVPMNLLLCFMGVLMGTLVGVLPGLGPAASISLLLPMTFKLTPEGGIIMLSGIMYGAMYGGSTTSILVNMPGEAASVVTCLDGYEMAKQGRAGAALGISAFGSFIAGTLSILGTMLVAPPLAKMALKLGPPEYFSLMLLGVFLLICLCRGSVVKAFMMGAFGFLLSSIGQEVFSGTARFTFGIFELYDGVGIIPVVMGLFGITEVLVNLEETVKDRSIVKEKISSLLPTREDWKRSIGPILRGTAIGFPLGGLPGGGAVLSTFASYAVEKKTSKDPEKFGKGAIEGVAGPESANNAACQAAFVPLLTLGIPPHASMAIVAGALMMHNIVPGPLLMADHPDIFWGVICSMYLGNVMLLVLNLPLIGMWVKVLKIPYAILFPLIVLVCLIGAYSMNNSWVDMLLMISFGIAGFFMRKLGYEPAPVVLGVVLGKIMEPNLRLSLMMSQGSFSIFFTRPISLAIMICLGLIVLAPFISKGISKFRNEVATDGEA